jgi:hypothetical protein
MADARGSSVVPLPLDRMRDIIRDLVAGSTVSISPFCHGQYQKQEVWAEEPPEELCLTTGEDEECLLTHPRRLLAGFLASSGFPPHPHPQWFSGFWRPFESPGPVPVTEDAAIFSS